MCDPRENEHVVAPQPAQDLKETPDNEITYKDNLNNLNKIITNSNSNLKHATIKAMELLVSAKESHSSQNKHPPFMVISRVPGKNITFVSTVSM